MFVCVCVYMSMCVHVYMYICVGLQSFSQNLPLCIHNAKNIHFEEPMCFLISVSENSEKHNRGRGGIHQTQKPDKLGYYKSHQRGKCCSDLHVLV